MVQENPASRAILLVADGENADSRQTAQQHNATPSLARKESISEPDPAVRTSTVCDADRGSSRQEAHTSPKATTQKAEERQIVTTAKCFIAPGLLALQEADRTLRQHISLETIFDSDYLTTTHETLPQGSRELRSRKGGLPNHASASTPKSATALDVGQLKVSNLSPLEGLRSRFMRNVAKLVPPVHRYAVEPQGRSARFMAQPSGTRGWTELRAPLDLRAAVESWNYQRGPEYIARLQNYLNQLVQIRSKMEDPSCTLAVHALWDLSVCEGNRLTMQTASGVSAALVCALSDEKAIYARGTLKGETSLLRVQQAAGSALVNLCCELAREEFILELHRMRALSKCIEALSHLGMEACLVDHEDANGKSQHADASAADTLCSLAAALSNCLPGPDAMETECLLHKYGNFVLCVMQETQRPKVFRALMQTLCTWLDPERFSRSSGTASIVDNRCSLILCSLLSIITHNECATDQDRFAAVDMAAQCVRSQQGAVADLFSGIYLSLVSGSSHSRHEGYQVVNLSMMYHLARCLHFCLSAHLQQDFDDPLKEDTWRLPAELSKHSCFDGAHDNQDDSDRLYRELAAEQCLAALQGLAIQHARRSKILPPPGTLVFLWRLLMFVFDVAPILRERALQTLAGCCFLENFMEVMPSQCAVRLASIIQDAKYHDNSNVAILLHSLCSSPWGCKFLCMRNDGLCTLLRHIEAAQDSEVCILLASAVEKFSSHIVRDDFWSEQSNKASEFLETSTVKAEWMRWARGLDRLSAHKTLDRFGALSMDLGDDFDEPCFSLYLRPDAWDVNVQDCTLPSTDSIGLLCQVLRGSSKTGREHDSSKVVESLSNAVQMFCATEHLLSGFDRATTGVLLDSTTGCLRAGVKSFGNLLHAIESIAQSEKGIAILDSQLEKISCIVQAALYLQAQDTALEVFGDLADGCMRLVWKLVRAGSNLEADGQLLSIVYYGAIQPGLGLTQRQACANMLLDLFLRKDALKVSNTRRRQLFGLVSDGDDASLVACLALLDTEDLKLQIIGAQFISHGAWTGATSTQTFVAASGLRALVEMAWQSRNAIARQEGLRALLELSTKYKTVQIALARDALLELILLAKHVAVVSESGVQEKGKKGEKQVEEREEEKKEEEKNKKQEKLVKRASKSTESHHKQYLQRCLSQIITALQSNHKNRTLFYQNELRLSMDASLAFETHQLPWTIEDDEDSLKEKNQSRCQDLQTTTTSIRVEYQDWMSAAFQESSFRNHLYVPARPVPQESSLANRPGRKRRPPMQQRRLLYKSEQSLWKPTTQATDGGSRWEPHIITAEVSTPSPTAEQNLVPQILEDRDGSDADHGQSIQRIQDSSVLVKRDEEEEEKQRHAILQSLGIQLRDASREKKRYRVMTDRMYTFASNESSLKARALASASNSAKPGMSLFHHVLGSKVSDTCGLKKVQLDEENVIFVYTTTEPAIPLLPRAQPGPVPSTILCTPTFEDFQRTSIGLLYQAGAPTMSALKSVKSFIPRTTRKALAPSECVFTRFGEYLRAKQLQAPWDKYGTLNAASFAVAIISPSLYKLIRENDGETASDDANLNEGFSKSFRRRRRNKLK